MAAFAGFVALMVLGYTVTDVGGWQAVGLIALVLVPVTLLCLLAWWRPAVAVPVLAVATVAPVAWGVMQLLDYERWTAWEDQHGPISLVLVVGVGAALAVLGLSRPTEAGVMMLVVVLAPVLLEVLGAGSGWTRPLSIALVLFPVLVSGSLFVVAGRAGDGRQTAARPGRFAH
jgi:hypothetical protein